MFPRKKNSYYLLIAGLCVLNLLVFLWPIASSYSYREFEPPKRGDVTVAFGRSVAGLHASKAVARPLSATLSRVPTIKPYASTAAQSARMQRAATSREISRQTSNASSVDRFGATGSGAVPLSLAAAVVAKGRSASLDEGGRRGSFEAAAAAAPAAATATAFSPILTTAARATPEGSPADGEQLGPLGIPSSAKARRAAEHASPLACAQEGEEEEEEEEEEGEEDKRKKRPFSSS